MANNVIKRIWNQNKMVNIEALQGMAFQAEDGGHTFEISGVDDHGNPVALSGTVAGIFRRPDNADIALTGTASDGIVSVTLTDSCYTVPGKFGLTIYTTADSKKTAVYAAIGTVASTSGGAVAGDTPQDVLGLILAIAAAVATIPPSYSGLIADIAPAYSNSALYPIGAYSYHDGDLYRCIFPITTAETWTAAHWTEAIVSDDITILRNDLHRFSMDAYDTDWAAYVGATDNTLLQSDGSTAPSSLTVTTGFMPVVAGKTYVIERPNSDSYTVWRCTYDSNKSLLSYLGGYTFQGPTRDYLIPAGTAYVRFSVSKGVYKTGFVFRLKENRFDDIEEKAQRVDLDTVSKTQEFVAVLGVEQGQLQSNGTVSNVSGYYTTEYLPVDEGEDYVIGHPGTSSYTVRRCTYDASKNLVSYLSDFSFESPERYYKIPLGVKYVRFTISESTYTQGFTFRPRYNEYARIINEFNREYEVFPYYGTMPSLNVPNGYYCGKLFPNFDVLVPSGYTAQGMAIYNNILFQFMDSNLVSLYNLGNFGEYLGSFAITCGHGNTASFSTEFQNSADEFPLVYVSDINGKVYVNKITRSSATLVKTLWFPSSTFGYAPQLALDNANNICYIVAKTEDTETSSTLKITKCNLASLTQNGDGTYTPAVVETYTITPGSVWQILQGVKYLNGHVYIASGGASTSVPSDIAILNVTSHQVVNHLNNFQPIPTLHELEDIEFYPNPFTARYDIIMHIREYGYYKLVF